MNQPKCKIELLVNPFCLCERDYCKLRDICKQHQLEFETYNLWELDDTDVEKLPGYMARLIKEWRAGQRGGSVYSSVFIDGERFPINDWPKSFETVEQKIAIALQGSELCSKSVQ